MANKSISNKWPLKYSPPCWLPDWRHEDEYPVLGCTSKTNYAWEFLRRNPDYQIDYVVCHELCLQENVADRYLKSLGLNISPPLTDEPIVSMKFHAALYRTLSKWGLAYYLLDPSIGCHETAALKYVGRIGEFNYSKDFKHFVSKSANGNQTREEIPLDGGIIPQGGESPWLFDIYLPIKPQVDAAREWLIAVQQEALAGKKLGAAKADPSKFNNYLRVLDADARGASDKEIMSLLCPDKDQFSYVDTEDKPYKSGSHNNPGRDILRNYRNAAYIFRDTGYKLLFE